MLLLSDTFALLLNHRSDQRKYRNRNRHKNCWSTSRGVQSMFDGEQRFSNGWWSLIWLYHGYSSFKTVTPAAWRYESTGL